MFVICNLIVLPSGFGCCYCRFVICVYVLALMCLLLLIEVCKYLYWLYVNSSLLFVVFGLLYY